LTWWTSAGFNFAVKFGWMRLWKKEGGMMIKKKRSGGDVSKGLRVKDFGCGGWRNFLNFFEQMTA
jgi:hypothetical protein